MRRIFFPAVLAVLLLAGAGHARSVVKEMQATRSGTLETKTLDQVTVYQLMLPNDKAIVIGDRAFFPPATQAMLDQAVKRKLTVTVTGQLLVHGNKQPAVFTLPLASLEVAGLEAPPPPPQPAPTGTPEGNPAGQQLTPAEAQRAQLFENARLTPTAPPLGKALNDYPYFTSRSWRLLDPNRAEFRGGIDPAAALPGDKRLMRRLRTRDLAAIFKSVTFATEISLAADGTAESKNVTLEATLQDGSKIQASPKDASSFFDRIFNNRKLKLDSILEIAAQNPNYRQ